MRKILAYLDNAVDRALGFVFGNEEVLETIKCGGVEMPADYPGSYTDFVAQQKGLARAPKHFSVEEPRRPSTARSTLSDVASFRVYVAPADSVPVKGYHWR